MTTPLRDTEPLRIPATWDDSMLAYLCDECGLPAYDSEGDIIRRCQCGDFMRDGHRYWRARKP